MFSDMQKISKQAIAKPSTGKPKSFVAQPSAKW